MTATLPSISTIRAAQSSSRGLFPATFRDPLGGTYRVRHLLASGSMGLVFEAEHIHVFRLVALKVRAPGGGSSAAQFEREARTHGSLNHPHIVQVLDYGVDGDLEYLVLELLRGETLRDRLSRLGVLTTNETVTIVCALASALAYAHSSGVVHRDLKPENVFLAQAHAQPFVTKLLDFGICSSTDVDDEESGIRGTPRYMSPEQLQGRAAEIGGSSDQFSLAILAYELLTGTHPFGAVRPWGTLQRIVTGDFEPISTKRSVPCLQLDAVFARALAKEPAQRFGSVEDFSAALASALWTTSAGESQGRFGASTMSSGKPTPPGASLLKLSHGEQPLSGLAARAAAVADRAAAINGAAA